MSFKKLTITSDPQNLLKVESYLQKLKEEYNICDDRFPDVLISLTEAVNNAIIHGNKVDITKKVCIKSKSSYTDLTLTVSDEGKGFSVENIPDPLQEENMEKCGGRGVFIMNELCDKLSYRDNGSTVKLVFHAIRK